MLPGDASKAIRAAIIAFAVAVGQIAGETSYQSLFSMRFGVEYLPFMYAIEVGIIPLEIWLFVKLAERYGKAVFFNLVFGCLTAAVLFQALVLLGLQFSGSRAAWFYPILFLVSNVADRGFVTVMWMLAEEMCTTRQAKRIFPVLIGSYTIGSILTGFVIHFINADGGISPEGIYFIWPCMMLLAGQPWRQLVAQYIQPLSRLGEQEPSPNILASIRIIRQSAFLRVALVVMVLVYGLAFLMEYQLTAVSRAAYTNEEELTAFWGMFLGVFYTTGLVVGGFILGRLLERFGIGSVTVIIAGLTLLAYSQLSLLIATPWTLATVFAGGLMMYIVMYTMADPTYQLFFKTLPPHQRTGARLVFGGALFAGGKLLCSALSTLHSTGLISLPLLPVLGVLLSACMLLLALKLKPLYFAQMLSNIEEKFVSVQEISLPGRKPNPHTDAPPRLLAAACCERLASCTQGLELVEALRQIGQPQLAALTQKRYEEIWQEASAEAWSVLALFTDERTIEQVKAAINGTDSSKREMGLDILAEGLGCRPLSQALLAAIEQRAEKEL